MRARIRDTEIYFDVDGAGLVPDGPRMRERPTAFIIHGGPGVDHSHYKPIGPKLTERMQVVYFDHRGNGRSARGDASRYTLDENVEDMEALRCHLGLKSIISIGFSYGGRVALAHAARYPNSVSHLIAAVAVSHGGYVQRTKQIVAERGTLEQIAQCEALFAGELDTPEKMVHYFKVMGPLYSLKYNAAASADRWSRPIYSPEALNRAHGPDGFWRTFDLRPELHQITARTLILAGRHDWICAPEFCEEVHRLIPSSQLHVCENSSHNILSDDLEGFLTALTQFLGPAAGPFAGNP